MTTQTLEQAADEFSDLAATKTDRCNECGYHSVVKIEDAFLAGAQFERDRLMSVVKEYCLSGNVVYPHRLLEKLEEMK